tara:strand:- start:2024 stop:2167 length:144 start_codon:yes stop_codon:yes gene_type:complete
MKNTKINLYDNLPGVTVNTKPGDEKKAMQPITRRAKDAAKGTLLKNK